MSADFFEAIKAGNREKVENLLLESPGLIHEKENAISPILLAAYHHQPAIADLLAEKTVTLSIFEAAATGRTAYIIILLAREPELINAYAEDGFQPLGLACFFGHYDTAEFLVKAGASANSYSNNALHATPLQSAVAAQHLSIVKLLLANGADPNCREAGGYTPLHAAAHNGDVDVIRALIYGGADLEARGEDGKLPVDLALDAEQEEAARLLMEGITRRNRTRRPTTPKA
jgi:ankyrin repeat protein